VTVTFTLYVIILSTFVIKEKLKSVKTTIHVQTYKYHATKTAKKIKKKVILLCNTSPLCQCGAE